MWDAGGLGGIHRDMRGVLQCLLTWDFVLILPPCLGSALGTLVTQGTEHHLLETPFFTDPHTSLY